MVNDIKLSIIIPYFETYELTKKLLVQLYTQINEPNIEIILIDDGCNEMRFDDYVKYLEGLGLTTSMFNIIHQENMGVAKTRNKGIELAKGQYIAFIDCDDQITMDYIDTLLNAIDTYDTDIINFNWYDMTTHIEARKPNNFAPWKAIYKKETMPIFSEDFEYGHEDVIFQGEIDKGIEIGRYTITYLDKLLYLYNSNREGSLIWKKTHKQG